MTSQRRQVLHPQARERAVRQVRRHAWQTPSFGLAFAEETVKGLFTDFLRRFQMPRLAPTVGLTMKDDPDRVVGNKGQKGHLFCTNHLLPFGTHVTAKDLEYGGTCFTCGRDLLA